MDPAWITVANKTLQPHGSVKSKLAIKINPEHVIRCPNTSTTVCYFTISPNSAGTKANVSQYQGSSLAAAISQHFVSSRLVIFHIL